MNTKRIFIQDLQPGDVFFISGSRNKLVAHKVFTEGSRTRVLYRHFGETEDYTSEYVRVNLGTVDRLI